MYCFKASFPPNHFLAASSFRDCNPILPEHFFERTEGVRESLGRKITEMCMIDDNCIDMSAYT